MTDSATQALTVAEECARLCGPLHTAGGQGLGKCREAFPGWQLEMRAEPLSQLLPGHNIEGIHMPFVS